MKVETFYSSYGCYYINDKYDTISDQVVEGRQDDLELAV